MGKPKSTLMLPPRIKPRTKAEDLLEADESIEATHAAIRLQNQGKINHFRKIDKTLIKRLHISTSVPSRSHCTNDNAKITRELPITTFKFKEISNECN